MKTASYLETQRDRINQHLATLLPRDSSYVPSLYEAARYSLLDGGKRLRPILTLTVTEALGGDSDHALTPACCLEMIHAYSLIHDDLPCMDDDDMRRGKPTLHKVYSEGHAVLTGDYLLTLAFEKLATAPFLDAEKKIQLIACLAKESGAEGMIGGQVMDIEAGHSPVDAATLKQIHLRKTGALIRASFVFGAIVAGAAPQEKELMEQVGITLGLAFQIVDDIIDIISAEEKHGKAKGSDAANGKVTYATLLGFEAAQQQADQLLCEALAKISSLPSDTSHLEQIATTLVQRTI